MARIKNTDIYVFDTVPEASSFLLGSDQGDGRITKSYRIDDVFGLLPGYGYFTDAPADGQPYFRQDNQWILIPPGQNPGNVLSVFGRTGAVTAQVGDYSAFYAPLVHTHTESQITDLRPYLLPSDIGITVQGYSAALDAVTGVNTGDQTSIVGITGTKLQFNTALTDGDFKFVGDPPTAHTHVEADITDLQPYLLSVGISDINATGTPSATTSLFGDGTWKNVVTSVFGRTGAVVAQAGDYSGFYAPTVHTHTKSQITDFSVNITEINATGSPNINTWLRGDGNWATIATSLTALSDVSLTAPAEGQYLRYTSGFWVNAAIVTSDVSNLASYTGLDVRYYTETEIDSILTNYVDRTTNQTIGGEKTFTAAFGKFDGRLGVSTDVFGVGRLGDSVFQATSIDTTSINLKDTGQLTALAIFSTAVGGSDGYVTSLKNFVDDVNVLSVAGVGTSTYSGVGREVESTLGLRNDYTTGEFTVLDMFNQDYDAVTEVADSMGWVAIHGGTGVPKATAKEIGLWRYDETTYTPIWKLSPTNVWTFSVDVNVPSEAYSAAWNLSNEVPTKGDLYTKIESLPTSNQTLSWNSSLNELTISAGNTVAISSFTFQTYHGSGVELGDSFNYLGEDNGVSGQRWLWGKNQGTDAFQFGYQSVAGTDTSGSYTTIATINPSGTPSAATDLIDKAYADATYLGGGATILNDLTDVTITAATAFDFLRHNGTAWVDVNIDNLGAIEGGQSYDIVNLNTINVVGQSVFYRNSVAGTTNAPTSNDGYLFHWANGDIAGTGGVPDRGAQIAVQRTGGREFWYRTMDDKVWYKLLNTAGGTMTGDLNIQSGGGESLSLIGNTTGAANTAWMSFYESNGTTRQGYVGFGSAGNTDIYLAADSGAVRFVSNGSSYVLEGASGDRFGVVPTVRSDGVMEIGRYIDFHQTDGSIIDNFMRLDANSDTTLRLTTSGISVSVEAYQAADQYARLVATSSGGAITLSDVGGTDSILRGYGESDFYGGNIGLHNTISTADGVLRDINFYNEDIIVSDKRAVIVRGRTDTGGAIGTRGGYLQIITRLEGGGTTFQFPLDVFGDEVRVNSSTTLSANQDFNVREVVRIYDASANRHQRVDARVDNINEARLHWYGVNDASATVRFRHAWYDTDQASYINVTAQSGGITWQNAGSNTADKIFRFDAGTAGDCILQLVADQDNNNEDDIPRIQFYCDGGLPSTPRLDIGAAGNANVPYTGLLANESYIQGTLGLAILTNNGTLAIRIPQTGNISILRNTDITGALTVTGNITGNSDARLKENIEPIKNGIEKVKQLVGVTFDRTDMELSQAGFLAQNVREVLPVAVGDEGEYLTLDQGNAIPALIVQALNELIDRVEKLEEKYANA